MPKHGELWTSLLSSIKKQSTTKQKSVNKPQQRGLQLESMHSFTDGLYCSPRIATREGEGGNRGLDCPCTKHSFQRKQNILVNVLKKKKKEKTLILLSEGKGRHSKCLSVLKKWTWKWHIFDFILNHEFPGSEMKNKMKSGQVSYQWNKTKKKIIEQ